MERHKLRELREKVNLFIYDSKTKVLGVLSVLNVLVAVASIGILIYYYGFPQTKDSKLQIIQLIGFTFSFYILRYLIKIVYDFNVKEFIRKTWLEASILTYLLLEGISYNVFGTLILGKVFQWFGFKSFTEITSAFIQLFFVIYFVVDLIRKKDFKFWYKVSPGLIFTFFIGILILGGAGLLMLPEMNSVPGGLSFTDALFLSTSSASSTGLSTIDTALDLTFKGQVVCLFLIKIGGLNTIAFGALYLLISKMGVSVKQHSVIEDFINKDSFLSTNSMFGKIVIWSLTIEFFGALFFFISMGTDGIFADTGDRFFHAIFHSVSAFNNAGISIIPGGLMHPDISQNYIVLLAFSVLIFLGGFGMIYLFDLFEISKIRERMKTPWKTIQFGTKISLYFTLFLLVVGTILFYISESNNTMKDMSWFGKFSTSIFGSMTTRNAGFNSFDISALSTPTLILFLFLMFVGSSSGSSGGGIRTSTFAILYASVISTVRGKSNVELFYRTIPTDMVSKAYTIFMFFVLGNLIGPFLLSITEFELLKAGKFTFMDLVFEHVSAASTVGLSTGLTNELSEPGKYVIIMAMFIGRMGTLTLAYLFGKEVVSKKYKYPTGHTMLG
jgi:Trk-type K+ transport system membrane component